MMSDYFSADVVVVGGGVSGVAAAVAASRIGARVILIEQHSFLGGNATGGLVGPFSTTYFNDKKVIAGIVDEVISGLAAHNATLGTQKCPYPPGVSFGTGGWITTFDPEILKIVFDELVTDAGVKVLFNTHLRDVMVSKESDIKLIWAASKAGKHCIAGRIFIDTTGDGDLAAYAGTTFEVGSENGDIQPASLMVDVDHVDFNQLKQYAVNHPEEFAWITYPYYHDEQERVCIAGSGFLSLIREAKRKGDLILGRNRITFFSGVQKDRLKLNATRLDIPKTDDIQAISSVETGARVQVNSLIGFIRKYLPGCQGADICAMGDYIGVRESRRIMGEYVLNREDVLSGARFADAIGCGAYPIDKHKSSDQEEDEVLDDVWIELEDAYDIPYRCLVPLEINNLLVAGRPISTTHDAMASTRLMVHCMVTGQAAGVAAGLSTKFNVAPRDVDVELLQSELIKQKAFIRKE